MVVNPVKIGQNEQNSTQIVKFKVLQKLSENPQLKS